MPGDAGGVLVDDLPAGLVERRGPLIDTVLALRLRAATAASRRLLVVSGCRRRAARRRSVALAGGSGLLLDVGETLAVGAPCNLALALLLAAAAAAGAGVGIRRLRIVLHAQVDGSIRDLREQLAVGVPQLVDRPEAGDGHVVGERLHHAGDAHVLRVGRHVERSHHRRRADLAHRAFLHIEERDLARRVPLEQLLVMDRRHQAGKRAQPVAVGIGELHRRPGRRRRRGGHRGAVLRHLDERDGLAVFAELERRDSVASTGVFVSWRALPLATSANQMWVASSPWTKKATPELSGDHVAFETRAPAGS